MQQHRFIAEVKEFLVEDFERTQVRLELRDRCTGSARTDENELERLVYDIARNAMQAMPDGGTFTFTVDREGDDRVLRLEDNGFGIPKAIADRRFQSFSIRFESTLGQGTTFEVRLPAGVSPGGTGLRKVSGPAG